MNKLRILELFGGVGACSKALERLGIDYEIADYVEIDKYAVKSFNAIHNTNFEPQDITKWDKDIEVDLIMHGSPCQDFSLAGLQAGGDEGSGTRSSLMYETIRIVKKLKLKDMLEDNVDEKYYLSDDKIDMISHWNCFEKPFKRVYGKNSTLGTLTTRSGAECGGLKVYSNDLEDTTNLQEQCLNIKNEPKVLGGIGEKKSNDGTQWYQQDRIYDNNIGLSLSTCANPYYPDNQLHIRKLTPKECWRLMGFDDSDFEKASKVNSNAQLYKQAGNSIVVNVLMAIFNELLKKEGE